jgi:beta-glucosidase
LRSRLLLFRQQVAAGESPEALTRSLREIEDLNAPTVASARIPPDGRATASVEVNSTGNRAGDEVVQLYIRAEVGRTTRPVMELKGFRRITLAPGEGRAVTIEVGPEQLSYHGPDLKRVAEPGRFRFMVGGSSAEVKSVWLDVVAP